MSIDSAESEFGEFSVECRATYAEFARGGGLVSAMLPEGQFEPSAQVAVSARSRIRRFAPAGAAPDERIRIPRLGELEVSDHRRKVSLPGDASAAGQKREFPGDIDQFPHVAGPVVFEQELLESLLDLELSIRAAEKDCPVGDEAP